MPWEKSFNEEAAVNDAMLVFWQKGFDATSISDLLQSTKLNKGSFYNAYGGKKQIFLRTLAKYDLEKRQQLLAELEALDAPDEAIRQFFDIVVNETLSDPDKKGCYLINTALSIEAHQDEAKDLVEKAIGKIEAFFKRCIELGQVRNIVPTTLSPEATAKTLLALAVAIRVLGRGAVDEAGLRVIADQAKFMIKNK